MGWSSTINVKDSLRWYLGKSVQIENTWVRATQNCIGIVRHGDSSENIDAQLSKIEEMVKRSMDQKLRLRNTDARHGRIETGVVIKNRNGMSGVGGKGTCYQRKEKKASVWMETNAVSGMRVTIAHKNQTTMPPHLPSHPCHEVDVCRGEEVSEAKVTMVPFFDNRADTVWKVLARDRPVNIGILPSVSLTKQKRAAKPGISVCSRITKLMNNQTKPKNGYYSHKRRESDDKNVAIVKVVPQLCCVSQNSDALVYQRGKQSLGNPMQRVLGWIRKGRFTQSNATSSKYPGKGPSLGKIQVKHSHQRSPDAMKLEDGSHEESERQHRCAASLELCQKSIETQRERPSYILLARWRMGTPGCVNKRAGGKRVCGGFRSWYAYGQWKRP